MALLHDLEAVLFDELLPSIDQAADEVVVDDLHGIASVGGTNDRGKLILVPLRSAMFKRVGPDEEPKRTADKTLTLAYPELLRSFFGRGDAWQKASTRKVYAAALGVAKQEHGKRNHSDIQKARRLGCAVSMALLARRGIRLQSREELPPLDGGRLAASSDAPPLHGSLAAVDQADSLAATPANIVESILSVPDFGV